LGRYSQSECSVSQDWKIKARTVEAHQLRRRRFGEAFDKRLDQFPFGTGPDMNHARANYSPRVLIGSFDVDRANANNSLKRNFYKCVVGVFSGTRVPLAQHPADVSIGNFRCRMQNTSRHQIGNRLKVENNSPLKTHKQA
jgi:hypothetical protein